MLVHQRRAGWDAVDHQRCDQHGGNRAGRKAERQHRHECPGRGRVIGRFRSGNAGDRALAEFLRVLGEPPLDAVGQKARNNVRGAGGESDQKAENGPARDRHGRFPPFAAAGQQLAQPRRDHLADHACGRRRQNLAQPEQADRDRDDADSIPQLGDVEGVAEVPGHIVDADGAEQEPEARHQQCARQRCRGHVGEKDQAEHKQRGIFRRPEAQRECGERRRDQRQHQHPERAGDPRADGGDAQGCASASFLRHRIAVDAGHDRGGFARDPHQDRSGRAAVLRAVIDAGQHHHRLGGVEAESCWQENADAGKRPDARQYADDGADQAAEEGIPQDVGLQRDGEAEQETFHRPHC